MDRISNEKRWRGGGYETIVHNKPKLFLHFWASVLNYRDFFLCEWISSFILLHISCWYLNFRCFFPVRNYFLWYHIPIYPFLACVSYQGSFHQKKCRHRWVSTSLSYCFFFKCSFVPTRDKESYHCITIARGPIAITVPWFSK